MWRQIFVSPLGKVRFNVSIDLSKIQNFRCEINKFSKLQSFRIEFSMSTCIWLEVCWKFTTLRDLTILQNSSIKVDIIPIYLLP